MSKQNSMNHSVSTRAIYQNHWNENEMKIGLKNDLIKGSLRINSKNYKEAYVTHRKLDSDIFIYDKDINRALFDDIVAVRVKEKSQWKVLKDVFILLGKGKDYDSKNDFITIEVLLKAYPDFFERELKWNVTDAELRQSTDFSAENWWKYFQRTGVVVGILNPLNTRRCVGTLAIPERADKIKSARFLKFSPIDSRFPRLIIDRKDCVVTDVFERPSAYRGSRFVAKIFNDWSEMEPFPHGAVERCLSECGSVIEQEIERILTECEIITDEYPESVLESLDLTNIHESEYKFRRDFREKCVISIDPKTARDLDDALHIEWDEEQSLWKIGVHIADVTHYVTPDSVIDQEAARRTTTVYMVDRAVPMLPRQLCEHECSLTSGADKLTYSVFYSMTDDCEIVESTIERSVCRLACRLSYEDAQNVLNQPNKFDWDVSDFNEITPPFTPNDIASSVRNLYHLARQMREKRFSSGALAINQPKIGFQFSANNDDNSGEKVDKHKQCPIGYNLYKLGPSNHLIEEWMLRANMTVAEFLHENLPETAFLRNHPPPTEQAIETLNHQLTLMGSKDCCLDIGTADEFQGLMKRCFDTDDETWSVLIMNLCSKAMQFALYFCNNGDTHSEETKSSGDDSDEAGRYNLIGCHHFALNVPLYTHFTSPIRRYPDMIVHRQLTTVLMNQLRKTGNDADKEKIEWMERTAQSPQCSPESLSSLADICNKKRKDAKSADENSIQLFFSLFVESYGPFIENAVVVGTLDKAFDVLLISSGNTCRIHTNNLENMNRTVFMKEKRVLKIHWNRPTECKNTSHPEPITILSPNSSIDVVLSTKSESSNSAPKISVVLKSPGCVQCQKQDYMKELGQSKSHQLNSSEPKEFVDEERLCNVFDYN